MRRPLVLAGIGLAAGFLGALFGVGGGIVIVPALVALCAFDVKAATATSLAAIGFTAIFGTVRYGSSGDVHWLAAALVGVPATAGAFVGTGLQRRISSRRLELAFSGLIAITAVKLLIS
jgi:uncharacterized membrane protein YfcA